MRLLFNPFRVVPSGRSDHSRGSHPGLFYPTLSASVLRVTVEAVPEVHESHRTSLSESRPQSVSTFGIGSDINSDADPEDFPQHHLEEVEQFSPGCKPRGMQ
jgi:hypothetical protein